MEKRQVTTPRLFRPEALRSYALERRGGEAARWRQSRVALLWLAVGVLLAGLVGVGLAPVPVIASGPAFAVPGVQAHLVALLPPAGARARPGDRLSWRLAAGGLQRDGRVSAVVGVGLEGRALEEVLARVGLSVPAASGPVSVVEVAVEGGAEALPAGAPGSCPPAAGTVEVEVGSRPLYSLLPGLEWVPGERP